MASSAGKELDVQAQQPECWSPASQLPLRSLHCGHLVRESPENRVDGILRCQTCDQPMPFEGEARYVRDYVPPVMLSWDDSYTQHEVHPRRQAAGGYTYERMLAELAGDSQLLDLSTQTLRPQNITQPADSFLVWRAAPAGCTVRHGTIIHPPDSILQLAGYGATFNGTTFSGGVLMCAGPDCVGTFTLCTFEQCTLYAVAGARARFSRCHFHHSVPAVVASGAATAACFASCVFDSCQVSIIAVKGAGVSLHASLVVDSAAAVVTDAGSHAELAQSTMRRMRWEQTAMNMRAVTVGEGGRVRVRECQIGGAPFPVIAEGEHATVELQSTLVTGFLHAIISGGGARITMHGVEMNSHFFRLPPEWGDSVPSAINISGIKGRHRSGTIIQLHRCSVYDQAGCGMCVRAGSAADVLLCTLRSEQPAIVLQNAGSRARVTHSTVHAAKGDGGRLENGAAALCFDSCTVSSERATCVSTACGALTARDTKFTAGTAKPLSDVVSVGRCRARMLRCRIEGGMAGVLAWGSTVRVVDSIFVAGPQRGVRGLGTAQGPPEGRVPVAVQATACRVEVKGGSMQAYEYGVLVTHAEDAPELYTHLVGVCFTGCHFCVMFGELAIGFVRQCRFVGCDVARARQVNHALTNGMLSGAEEEVFPAGVLYTCGAQGGAVEGCVFEGPWLGVEANADAPVAVRDCVFRDAEPRPEWGLWRWVCISVLTEIALEGCEISGARPGIEVCRGAKATIKRCKFEPDGASGMMMRPNSSATVLDSSFRGGTRAVFQAQGSRLVVQDCSCSGVGLGLVTDGGADIAAKRLTVDARYGGVLTQCTHAGASEVKLVDCKLRGGDFGVALRHASVSATLLRCEISNAHTGVSVVGSCSLKLRNSTVWDCGVGIGVGADQNMLIMECEVCGASGWGAYSMALKALEGARCVDGALCAHQGAVTRAVIENVSVKRCAQSGLAVCAGGHVVAKRLRAVRCGIAAVGVAERSRFEDCTVTEGHHGTLELLTGGGGEQVSASLPGVRVVPEGAE